MLFIKDSKCRRTLSTAYIKLIAVNLILRHFIKLYMRERERERVTGRGHWPMLCALAGNSLYTQCYLGALYSAEISPPWLCLAISKRKSAKNIYMNEWGTHFGRSKQNVCHGAVLTCKTLTPTFTIHFLVWMFLQFLLRCRKSNANLSVYTNMDYSQNYWCLHVHFASRILLKLIVQAKWAHLQESVPFN